MERDQRGSDLETDATGGERRSDLKWGGGVSFLEEGQDTVKQGTGNEGREDRNRLWERKATAKPRSWKAPGWHGVEILWAEEYSRYIEREQNKASGKRKWIRTDHTRVEARDRGWMTRVLNGDKTSGDGIKSNNLGDRTEGHSIHFEEEEVGKDQGTQRSLNRQISGEAAMVQAVVVCARGAERAEEWSGIREYEGGIWD
jgi:hypothetical protein